MSIAANPTRTWTSRVSAKGQVTLPKSARDEIGIVPGSEVSFEKLPSGGLVVRPRHSDARALGGLLSQYAPSEPVTIEQMNEAIVQASAERHVRSVQRESENAQVHE